MAYQNTFYIYDVPVTCTGDGSHDWITADFMIEASANASNTAYDVKIYARIDSGGRMNWTGDGDIRVTCNGTTATKQVALAMYSSGTTDWDGPATFTFGAPGEVRLNMNLDLDLTRTTGTNGGRGPTHNSDGGNLQHFYYNNYNITIGDGGLPPLIVAPTISTLTNNNSFNNNAGISASTNSISIKWNESGTVTNRYYRLNGGNWVSASSSTVTIPSLYAGTSYTIEVKSSNSAGDSNILSTTIRTRYVAPALSQLSNTNQYNNSTAISASTNSISIGWTESGGPTNRYYRLNGGNWISVNSSTITISGLTAGTSYTIEVYASNVDVSSNTLSTVIRTRHNTPVVALTYSSNKLDSLTFNWTSDKPLISSQYKVNDGSWVSSSTGTSGTIIVERLTPNTTYTIYFRGVSTSAYDSLSSNEDSDVGTTLNMARIVSIGNCIFGNSISITISNVTTNTAKLKIWTTGNLKQPEFEFNVVNGENIFNPTQDQLDQMYRCFTNSNSVPIYFSLTTIGTWGNWTDTEQNKSLQLTGIVKTGYIGINNNPRRGQLWLGQDNVPRRAIMWIGDDNNKPRRCT